MRKTRVLIVEDETIISLDVQSILVGLGYEVAGTAATGEAAIEKALSLDPDIILMDILLAGKMDGIEAARAIRRNRDIPIIYLTANADRATVDRAQDTLPYTYLNKPIHERDLYSNIESAVVLHRAEAKLRESERRFRDSLANARLFAVQLDMDGTILFCNDYMLETTGYTRDELLGSDWFAVFHSGNNPEELRRSRREALRTDRLPLHFDETLVNKAGEPMIVRWNRTILYGPGGEPLATSKIGEDITEELRLRQALLKANEELTAANEELQAAIEEQEVTNEELIHTLEALTKSESDYRLLFESLLSGFAVHEIILDEKERPIDYRFLHVNPAFERLTGLKAADIVGRTVLEVLPGAEPELIERYGAVALSMKPDHFEYFSAPLACHYEVVAFSPVRGQFATLFRDITDRIIFDRALQASEQKFRSLFETMSQGVVYQSAEGPIIDANPAAARLLGMTMDQLMGRTSADPRWKAIREDGSVLPGEEHPSMLSLATGKRVENFIMGVYNPEIDTYRWLSVSANPIFREAEERPYMVFTSFTDITDIRNAHDELKSNKSLMERAFDMFGLGYWEFDLERRVATGSSESRRIYGLGDGDLPLADVQNLALPEYRPMLDKALERLVKHNEKYEVVFKIRRADKSVLVVHSQAEYSRATNRVFGVIREMPQDATGAAGTSKAEEPSESSENKRRKKG